jgi:ATP-binding cassette subfamily B protein RaxB
MLYAFISYKERFKSSADGLLTLWIDWRMLDLHLGRISDIVHTESESSKENKNNMIRRSPLRKYSSTDGSEDDVSKGTSSVNKYLSEIPRTLDGKIEVRGLGYRYGANNPFIFENLNFTIEAGETVFIRGASGCGKSTLLKCLMGLLEPTCGEIYIDGIPLRQFTGYRSQISAVMQEQILFSGDIAENISCFATDLDMNLVRLSAKRAAIHEEVMSFPMQYQTQINDAGVGLSGGQKQRIAWARALYVLPKILFLDEATSNLDLTNRRKLADTLDSIKITKVIISHAEESNNKIDKFINL